MDDVEWQNVLIGFVDDVLLDVVLRYLLFVVNEEGIELSSHELGFLIERYALCDVFSGKDIGFADSCPANQNLIVLFVFFIKFL